MKDLICPTTSQKKAVQTEDCGNRISPLNDEDLSELTKKEILFWSRKLELTPSELFTLSEADLEKHLDAAYRVDFDHEERQERYSRWRKLSDMKRQMLEIQQTKPHADNVTHHSTPRSVWEIMAQAAMAIEELYGTSPTGAIPKPTGATSSRLARASSSTRRAFSNSSRYNN